MRQEASVVVEHRSLADGLRASVLSASKTSLRYKIAAHEPTSDYWFVQEVAQNSERMIARCNYEIDAKRLVAAMNMIIELADSMCGGGNIDSILGLA